MKKTSVAIGLAMLWGMASVCSAQVNVHISESGATVNGENIDNLDDILESSKANTTKNYIQKGSSEQLKPAKNKSDAEKLAESIEFEVFEIGENYNSHSVYESGAGICRGYKSNLGVDLTDSSTYYVKGSDKDYYASISSAKLTDKSGPNNVQYAPVFNITDPNMEKTVRAAESKHGRKMVSQNVNDRNGLLSDVVCK